jgi:hypothetical protein
LFAYFVVPDRLMFPHGSVMAPEHRSFAGGPFTHTSVLVMFQVPNEPAPSESRIRS